MEKRALGLALVLSAAVAVPGAISAAAPAAETSGSSSLSVRLVGDSQRATLRRGALRLRVRAPARGRVRVAARARGTDPGARFRRIARPRVVSFGRAGTRTVTLALTAAGERRLSRCAGRELQVAARSAGSRRAAPLFTGRAMAAGRARAARDTALLRIDSGRCVGGPNSRGIATQNAGTCDFLDPAVCLQPWPNDYFTRRDAGTDTGRRLDFEAEAMPENVAGKPIDPTEFNRSDGFSPGNLISTKVPGLERPRAFEQTGAVPLTDLSEAFEPDQPVVVINARTRERHLIWAELDANPEDPRDVNLIVRPGTNFLEGERYIVALRDLKDADGRTLEPQPEFRALRDRLVTDERAIESRRGHFERLFRTLARAGIDRTSLYLAWDFTVASERNLSERMLHLRDTAFAGLGDTTMADLQVQGGAPPFVVTSRDDFAECGSDGCQDGESDEVLRRVEGVFTVPCYLNLPGCPPGSRFAYSGPEDTIPDRLPANTAVANFVCNIPRWAVEGPGGGVRQTRPSLYGHGLLGSAQEVMAGNVEAMGDEHGLTFCATDWSGMAREDVPYIATAILTDLSNFPAMADRLQQGFLNQLFMGRLMINPQGFPSHPAFQVGSQSVIDTARLFFDGNSQGGILGAGLTAVAPDYERAVLGVPAINYSTLLRRSVDFDAYAQVLYNTYPDELERPLLLSMIQLLWDRGEGNGYAQHMTGDPLPNTPSHEVLMHVAYGDHQVTNVAAEVQARTVGARLREPALDPGRHWAPPGVQYIPAIDAFPFAGSAFVYWDVGPIRTENGEQVGTGVPPVENVPNRAGEDPHGDPRAEVSARLQKSEFLRIDGRVIDVCGTTPCYADTWTGP